MNIVMIGAGNLATGMGIALIENGHKIVLVYSRSEESASLLASKLNCPFTIDLSKIKIDADIYIIAVKDNVISDIVMSYNFGDKLVVHTAGSVPIDVFSGYCKNFGVLYPLQTFSKNRIVGFGNIPICIEANSNENLEILRRLATSLSSDVRPVSSMERQQIHLAAVFVCNFVNHFYTIGEILVVEKGMDFGILKPLILETAMKAIESSPATVQTGPAVRNNKQIIDKHLQMLEKQHEWKEFYQLISNDIYKIQNNQ
jgi:predicted short-subunit dehydrogenase-like oxidoreductase (DUF2520 family)